MKTYKPVTKSRRNMSTLSYKKNLSSDKPFKSLLVSKKQQAGRNNAGRITTRHHGGGHKRRLRLIDFTYNKRDIQAKVETIEYDPYRSSNIARVLYEDGERRYVIVPKGMAVGDTFIVAENAPIKLGNRLSIGKIVVGTFIYNIELRVGAGARLVRSAGSFAKLIAHDAGYAQIKLPSGEVRKVLEKCYASVGTVGNEEHNLVKIGKAGRSRWMGRRPTVRGSAMNPVDHPYGGGEGRHGRGMRRAKTKWGKPSGKGQKTRTPKKYSNVFIVSRRKVGKRR